jgi:CRP/FNR family transcriptional regulator, cyclic AMP receptor protein
MKHLNRPDNDAMKILPPNGSGWKSIRFKKSDVIFFEGDKSTAMFYVKSGALKLTLVSASGKEAVMCVTDGGSIFGESCISLGAPLRLHNAVALTETHLVKIDRASILRMLRGGGDSAIDFVSFLLNQNAALQRDLATRLVGSTQESLVGVVSWLTRIKNNQPGLHGITQQTVAEMMGMSRQRVNALMKRFGLSLSNHRAGKAAPKHMA